MYVIPDNVIYDLPQLCRFLSTHMITRMMFTPSLLEAVLDTHSDETIRSTFRTFRYHSSSSFMILANLCTI